MIRTVQEEVTDVLDDFFSERDGSTSRRNVAMALGTSTASAVPPSPSWKR